jgi:hypothetical protein
MHKPKKTTIVSSFVQELNNGMHVLASLQQAQEYDFHRERN